MKRTNIKNRETGKNIEAKRSNKLTVVFIFLVIIGVIGILTVIYYVNNIISLKLEEDVYQYFTINRIDYPSGTKIENGEMSSILKGDEGNSVADPTPLYALETNRMYLPKSYTWYSIDDDLEWRIPEFASLLEQNNKPYICTINNKEYEISEGFLVDDNNTYVFLDNGTITINNESYDISKMSFYSYDYEITRIYDYKTKTFTEIEEKIDSVKYKSVKNYSIDLLRGVYTNGVGESLLIVSSPSLLMSIEDKY